MKKCRFCSQEIKTTVLKKDTCFSCVVIRKVMDDGFKSLFKFIEVRGINKKSRTFWKMKILDFLEK